jgi:replicative DNA helicase
MAVDHSVPVAVFSLEMSAVQLVTRLISAEAEVNAEKLKKGTLDQSDWSHLNRSIQSLEKAKIFIDDTPALSIFELRAKCRRLKSSDNIGVIIIDYLQLMTAGSDKGGNREQEISTISRSLKALAKELNVPIITLSQLNRSVETRTGLKRPQLSDLRESGAIEQDADMVCFLYRPEYYGFKQNEQGQIFADGYAEFIVAKHRNGALENIPIKFLNTFAKFTNLTEYFSDDDNSGGGLAPNNSFDVNKVMPSKMNIDDDMDTSLMDMPPISRSKTEDHNPF